MARGDSLSKIARQYGVSVKDLMAANAMKNADRLEAGASLVIPSSGDASAVAATPAVAKFLAGFFARSASGDINGLIDCYGPSVDYYAKGKSGTDIVRQDKAAYFERWPVRVYTPGAATMEQVAGGDVKVTVPVAYSVKKGDKGAQGEARFTFLLRPAGGSFRIVGEQSVATPKK